MRRRAWATATRHAAGMLLLLAALAACTSTERFGGQAEPPSAAPAAPPAPPPPQPPPVDVAGRWKLSSGSGGCFLTFGGNSGAAEGSIAPAGGCPGSFFTSRKWTYEHSMLIVRDHKGEPLAELAFANGHFEGKATNGAAVTLAH